MVRLAPLFLTLALAALASAKVTPRVDCVCAQTPTATRVLFAYTNDADDVTLAAGSSQNYMTPGPLAQGQPSHFDGGSHVAHSVLIDCVANPGGVAWIVQSGSTSTLRSALAPCVSTPPCVANQCGPPQPSWKVDGPSRGPPAISDTARFPETQNLLEFKGAVVNVIGNTIYYKKSTPSSSPWMAVFTMTLRATQAESGMKLAPVGLYIKRNPANENVACAAFSTLTSFRTDVSVTFYDAAYYGADQPPLQPSEFVYRMSIVCTQNKGEDWSVVYDTSATPTNTNTDERVNCLTFTDAGVLIACVHNAHVPSAGGILRSPTPLVPGSFAFGSVSSLAGGAFISDIVQKTGSPMTIYAFGYNLGAPASTELAWKSTDAAGSFAAAPIMTPASSPLLSTGTIHSIKVATSPRTTRANLFCMVVQGRDTNGAPSAALATGCTQDAFASVQLYQANGGTVNVLAPNSDDAYPENLLDSPTYDLNRATPIVIDSRDAVYVGAAHLYTSMDYLRTVVRIPYASASVENHINNLQVTASDDDDYASSSNYANPNARRERIIASHQQGVTVSRKSGQQFKLYKKSDEMLALLDGGIGLGYRVRAHPTEPATVYYANRGGLWESLDYGATKRRIDGAGTGIVGESKTRDVAISRQNPNVMYRLASVYTNGKFFTDRDAETLVLFKTVNRGDSWTRTCLDLSFAYYRYTRFASQILIDPTNHDIVFVMTESGIYRTKDGGATCVKIVASSLVGTSMRFKPNNTRVIYAVGGARFMVSRNGGDSFTSPKSPSISILGSPFIVKSATRKIDMSGPIFTYGRQRSPAHVPPSIASIQIVLANPDGTAITLGSLTNNIALVPYIVGAPAMSSRLKVLAAAAAGAKAAILVINSASDGLAYGFSMEGNSSIYAIQIDGDAKGPVSDEFAFGLALQTLVASTPGGVFASITPEVNVANAPDAGNFFGFGVSGLAVTSQDPELLYIIAASPNTFTTAMWASRDSAQTYTRILYEGATRDNNVLHRRGQLDANEGGAFFNQEVAIAVNPRNKFDLVVGIGSMFRVLVREPFAFQHIDIEWQHKTLGKLAIQTVPGEVTSLEWSIDGEHLYVANSGGFYGTRGNLVSSGLQHLNHNFKTDSGIDGASFYTLASSQCSKDLVVASRVGAQTGFIVRQPDHTWTRIDAGLGAGVGPFGLGALIDYSDDAIVYLYESISYPARNIPVFRTQLSSDRALRDNFAMPIPGDYDTYMAQHPTIPTTLYAARSSGTYNLHVSIDRGTTWQFVLDFGTTSVSAISTTRANPSIVYAVSATPAKIFKIVNGTAVAGANIPFSLGMRLKSMCVSQTNANLIIVTGENSFSISQVFRTADGGSTWQDITENLPMLAPVQCCLIDDTYAPIGESIYVGTSTGVLNHKSAVLGWTDFSLGIPGHTHVQALSMYGPDRELRAATYGNGMIKVELLDCPSCKTSPPAWCRRKRDDDDGDWRNSLESRGVATLRSTVQRPTSNHTYGTPEWWADIYAPAGTHVAFNRTEMGGMVV